MADEKIRVSTEALKQTANDFEGYRKTLKDTLDSIKEEMNNTRSVYITESGDEIRKKMNAMEQVFEDFDTVVKSYIEFLNTTSEVYERTDINLKSEAEEF